MHGTDIKIKNKQPYVVVNYIQLLCYHEVRRFYRPQLECGNEHVSCFEICAFWDFTQRGIVVSGQSIGHISKGHQSKKSLIFKLGLLDP